MPAITSAREPRLGVNIADLEGLDRQLRLLATKGKLDLSGVHRGPEDEDRLLAFLCPDLEAALACDIVRSEGRRVGGQPCRCYLRRGGRWVLLPNDAVLTRRSRGDAGPMELNPRWFPEAAAVVEAAPLLPEVL